MALRAIGLARTRSKPLERFVMTAIFLPAPFWPRRGLAGCGRRTSMWRFARRSRGERRFIARRGGGTARRRFARCGRRQRRLIARRGGGTSRRRFARCGRRQRRLIARRGG